MTQDISKTFVPDSKKAGDLIKSQDWNAAMAEIVRLDSAKVNRSGADSLAGPLTVQASLTVQANLSVPSGTLSVGTSSPTKKLHVENGELRVRASHNDATTDIGAFYSQNLTLGLGIGSSTIAAIGSNTNQDITITPKGSGALAVTGNFRLSKGSTVNELSTDGTLAGNADTALPTQKAVKTYVDTRLSTFAGATTQDFNAKNLTVAGLISGKLAVADTRAVNEAPKTFARQVTFDFKDRTVVKAPGSGMYSGMLTLAPWNDNTGNNHHQLNFNDGGIYWRQGQPTADSWGDWRRVVTDQMSDSFALTGAATLSFGSQNRQMLNLWGTTYAIGVQTNTQYFRSDKNFAWYRSGSHSDTEVNAGTNGTADMVLTNGSLGIGITAPAARLQVKGGAIMPDSGNSESAGLLFPKDAFGGGGDSAWLRYYARTGEQATLELGVGNDDTDHIALMPTGNVGIGTNAPTQKLDVRGSLKVTGGAIIPDTGNTETSGIMFPKDPFGGGGDAAWLRYYARTSEQATLELGISNDADDHIALMASGNVGIGTNTPAQKLDVVGNMKISGTIVQQDWQTPTLQNSWVAFDTTYNSPAYMKDSMGFVHLKGMIKGGVSVVGDDKSQIFTLPSGYRPAMRELHAVMSADNIGRVDIFNDGRVLVVKGGNAWVSLDGITFKVA